MPAGTPMRAVMQICHHWRCKPTWHGNVVDHLEVFSDNCLPGAKTNFILRRHASGVTVGLYKMWPETVSAPVTAKWHRERQSTVALL